MPRLALVLLAALACFPAASAQAVRSADVVTWQVRADGAARGGDARIVFDAEIADGWRLYALDSPVGRPLEVVLGPLPSGLAAGPLRQSKPQTGYDLGFERDYTYFAGSARVAQTVRVSAAAPAGRHAVEGVLAFAVCDNSVCLSPARVPFRVPVVVTAR